LETRTIGTAASAARQRHEEDLILAKNADVILRSAAIVMAQTTERKIQ